MRIALLLSVFFSLGSWAQVIDFRSFTKQLCSPEFSGRGYVNNGDSIASVFISQCFKSIGLKPLAGSYFQSFSFPVNTFPKKILVCTETDTLRPGIDFLVAPNSCGIKKTIHLIRLNPSAILSENVDFQTLQDDEALAIDYSGLPKDSLQLVKNKINQASRDPNLIMYQSENEEFGLDGAQVKPSDKTSWPTTLISDKSKVYKGGSWRDRAYWLVAGNRRFLDEDQSTCALGFRCCMDRVGSPEGFIAEKKKKKKK